MAVTDEGVRCAIQEARLMLERAEELRQVKDKAVALEVYSFLSGARQSIERGMERILDIYKLGRNT